MDPESDASYAVICNPITPRLVFVRPAPRDALRRFPAAGNELPTPSPDFKCCFLSLCGMSFFLKIYFYCYRHQTRQARFSRHRTARPPDAADLQLKAKGQSMARGRLSCGGKTSGVFPEMIHQRSYLSTSAITPPAGSYHCGATRSRSQPGWELVAPERRSNRIALLVQRGTSD